MNRSVRRFVVFCLLPTTLGAGGSRHCSAADGDEAFFESRIRPVLVARCYGCHSREAERNGKLRAGLFVDSRKGLLRGGESGPAVTVGQPGESLLIRSLEHRDDAPAMPPSEKLPDAVVADFREWIRRGLADPRTETAGPVRRGMTIEEGRRFWSLVPPRIEPSRREQSTTDAVDALIDAERVRRGLHAAPEAGRAVLLRRLHLDLTGLLPSPEETESFERDAAPDAVARRVDRLLASPHFGERWGRHWLDAVRYADSNGRDRNILWYHAWRYRDYVLRSFADDVPLDRFLREQIAGDLLPASTPDERDRLRIATGFLALGPKAFEESKPDVFRMDGVDEQIDVIGRSILGLSVACARCHDHKFDALPTRDYYALAGILRSTQPLYGFGPTGIKATQHSHSSLHPVGPHAEERGDAGLEFLRTLDRLTLAQNTARSDRYRVVRRLAVAKREGSPQVAELEAEIRDWDAKVKAAENALQAAMDAPPAMPGWAMGATEAARIEDCRIHVRGETTNLADAVPRGVPGVLPNPLASIAPDESGRRQLADWLADPRNPLTARVHVNRVWLHLFGRGLVATPDDFGVVGSRPSHPELLDLLAVRFVEQGWSTKRLVRDVVLSRTYRQSSRGDAVSEERDPDNVFLWRMSPRMLEVEAYRDALLGLSGRLDLAPPAPEENFLAAFHPYRENEYRNFAPVFAPDRIDSPHRSVYLPVVRNALPTMFALFDFADPDRPVAQREPSLVPAQALFLLNSPWVLGEARGAARRLLRERTDDGGRIDALYRQAYSRLPTAAERDAALRYVQGTDDLAADPRRREAPSAEQLREERWVGFCQAVFASAELRMVR